MRKLIPFLFVLFSFQARAEQFVGGEWRGLNSTSFDGKFVDYITISDGEAISLSNIDIIGDGAGIKPRSGYTVSGTIGYSTHSVRGGYKFIDSLSQTEYVFSNDKGVYRTTDSLVSIPTWQQFITTDTSGSHYDFENSNGVLWRTTSNRDEIASYNGVTTTYYPALPKGNQFELLPDRSVISGTSADPKTIHFSAAADFTDYTTGISETSAFTETVSLPGVSVNSIASACGGLLIWTDSVMGIWTGTNQFDANISKVANVGTYQPYTFAVDSNGILYFQGSDKNVYTYDCNVLVNISGKRSVTELESNEKSPSLYNIGYFDALGRYCLVVVNPQNGSAHTSIFDPKLGAWTKYSYVSGSKGIVAFGPETTIPYTLFGGSSTGTVNSQSYIGGGSCTDGGTNCSNGSSYTASWQTKYFTLGDPFTEKTIVGYSIIGRKNGVSSSFTLNYYVNGNTSGSSVTCNLYNSTSGYVKLCNDKFPTGLFGHNLSLKFSSTPSTSGGYFEIYGFAIEYLPRPWRVIQ